MTRSITDSSDVATQKTNTTGRLSPILEIQPNDGTELIIAGAGERGERTEGLPIYQKLRSAANTQLPADTTFAIELEEPSDDKPKVISEPEKNIRQYRTLTLTEQQNVDFVDQVKNTLKVPGIIINDNDKLYLSVDSSAQISWADSQSIIEASYVSEV